MNRIKLEKVKKKPCPKCGKIMRTDAITRHLKISCLGDHKQFKIMESKKKFSCPKCGKKMMLKDSITRHLKKFCPKNND